MSSKRLYLIWYNGSLVYMLHAKDKNVNVFLKSFEQQVLKTSQLWTHSNTLVLNDV